MRHTRVLTLAGLMVWLLAGVDMAQSLFAGANRALAWTRFFAWIAFASVFFLESARRRVGMRGSLLIQTIAALILIRAADGNGIETALLVMIAGQLPPVFPLRWCLVWVLAQTSIAILPALGYERMSGVIAKTFGYLSFELFALGAAGLAESERRAREELAAAKGRLEAVQERLAETTREAERLRIAREIHDSLGHHLTALSLDLELARHLAKGDAAAPVERARALASSLMADLRSAVTELRADSGEDLLQRLQSLARTDVSPRITVSIEPNLGPLPSDVGLALTRVAEEIATNATKHSHASRLDLSLSATARDWILEGRDDGKGVEIVRPGHGLAGMRERVEGIGGVLTVTAGAPHGFTVIASVPRS